MSVHYGDAPEQPVEYYKPAQKAPTSKKSQSEDPDAGEKYNYDKDFHGIDTDRHCTDCCCLFIFIIFICLMFALFFYALTVSNPKYLYIPTDYRSLLCGYDNSKLDVENATNLPDLTDRKYLFWTRPGKKGYVRSYCVSECPNSGLFVDAFQQNIMGYEGGEKDAPCGLKPEDSVTKRTVLGYEIPYKPDVKEYYCGYNTTALLDRCMPTFGAFLSDEQTNNIKEALSQNMTELLGSNIITTALQDVMNTYQWIAVAAVGTLVLAIIWVLLLRWTAGCFVWLTVLLALVASAALTYLCYGQKENQWNNTKHVEAYTFGLYNDDLNKKVFTVLFWVCIAWDVILVLLVIALFHKIKMSVTIIKIVSRVFSDVPTLFIFPIFIYIIMFVWWVYVVAVAIVLFGAGTPEYIDYDAELESATLKYTYNNIIVGLSIYHFVGFIWVSLFINDLGEMSLAGVFASWYFNREPRRKNMGRSPVLRSFGRSLRYHMGSLAFGSFIITCIKLIRAAIAYLQHKTKNTQNDIIKCLIKCCACCCWCFEKFMKFINRNAYILIAIHGYNFFGACKKAFGLILRNCISVATVNWVGDFTLFLGRVFVTGIVTAAACFGFSKMDNVTFYVVPGAIVCLIAFFASGAFTELFEMGIDSMFLCYMEDIERNDGSAGHELCGPPELVEQLNKNNNPEAEV